LPAELPLSWSALMSALSQDTQEAKKKGKVAHG